jgi:hypothetical protein
MNDELRQRLAGLDPPWTVDTSTLEVGRLALHTHGGIRFFARLRESGEVDLYEVIDGGRRPKRATTPPPDGNKRALA